MEIVKKKKKKKYMEIVRIYKWKSIYVLSISYNHFCLQATNVIRSKLNYYTTIYLYIRGIHILLLNINDKITVLNYTFHSWGKLTRNKSVETHDFKNNFLVRKKDYPIL